MNKEELEKLKQTIAYFGHWYDVIGEERVLILEKSIKYIEELEEQIEKMKRHANCKHCDSEGYCEVRKTYLIDLSYNGCDEWELED